RIERRGSPAPAPACAPPVGGGGDGGWSVWEVPEDRAGDAAWRERGLEGDFGAVGAELWRLQVRAGHPAPGPVRGRWLTRRSGEVGLLARGQTLAATYRSRSACPHAPSPA